MYIFKGNDHGDCFWFLHKEMFMGSFAFTCGVSGLPIEAGDPVRFLMLTKNPYHDGAKNSCYMHDLWFPRTLPLKGVYNDYGSVEDVEKGAAQDLWLEGLQIDLIERGIGDNSCHDVACKKDMTFNELLEALWEGRVLVEREARLERNLDRELKRLLKDLSPDLRQKLNLNLEHKEAPTTERPIGIPTMRCIEKIIIDSGRTVSPETYLVDELKYGTVRVRWGTYGGTGVEQLKALLPRLREYACMIRAGDGSYAHHAELIIAPKPGTKDWHGSSDASSKNPLPVGLIMIREDVWQAMLDGKIEVYEGKTCMLDFAEVRKRVSEAHAQETEKHSRNEWRMDRSAVPFTISIAEHIQLMERKGPLSEEFVTLIAEFLFVQAVLGNTRYQWRLSSSCGPQFGEWKKHIAFLSAMTNVARKIAKEKAAEEY